MTKTWKEGDSVGKFTLGLREIPRHACLPPLLREAVNISILMHATDDLTPSISYASLQLDRLWEVEAITCGEFQCGGQDFKSQLQVFKLPIRRNDGLPSSIRSALRDTT